ncbi:hypothetical protein GCM10028803_42880 [Larkinella knui]|uniref:Coproporphyrinogen III oxidase n=1 Tax=Larkinella knui TaxID=2025310 RepID=A0A3P1CPD4_9BACT|nr:hypothetical protein [Larkinella knui]RRB14916.1 hypothetical protein EHT87_10130 [Larkinella knui]
MKRIVKSVLFVATMVSLAAACQSKKTEDTTSTTDSTAMSSDSSMMSDTTMATDSMSADSAK